MQCLRRLSAHKELLPEGLEFSPVHDDSRVILAEFKLELLSTNQEEELWGVYSQNVAYTSLDLASVPAKDHSKVNGVVRFFHK